MSTTLKAIRRKMVTLTDGALGRVETVAALAAQSVGVSALAVGGASSKKLELKWMVRADSSNSADRVRLITTYDPTTAGATLVHTGAAYSDTTVGSPAEVVEILEYEPYRYDLAINATIPRIRRLDTAIIPTRFSTSNYYLGDLDWIEDPSHIVDVTYTPNPVVSRNRMFEEWNTIDSSGTLLPDWFTLAGASATCARSTSNVRRGSYTAAITRAGTNATLTQTVGLLETGVTTTSGDTLRGKPVTLVGVGWASSANQLRFSIYDGVTTTYTSYHTGDSTIQELSAQVTISSSATTLTIAACVDADGTCYVDEVYAIPVSLQDNVRRDTWPETAVPYKFDQGAGTLALVAPVGGQYGQFIIKSKRPYPSFDETRVRSGSADADTSDVPITIAATGAIARLYQGLAKEQGQDTQKFEQIAATWNRRFETLVTEHLYVEEPAKGGAFLPRYGGIPARRF